MRISTPAKINLFLEITGKRPDGYHEIETIFYPLHALCDEIFLKENSDGKTIVSCDHPEVPSDSSNLCAKAAAEYFSAAGLRSPSFHIEIKKNIPVAGGMGGGSSDAAAVLRLLQEKYGALSADDLLKTALKLGADVPFFLNPRPALATGVGEKLQPLDNVPKNLPLLILAPDFPVSAAWGYKHFDRQKTAHTPGKARDVISALHNGDMTALADTMRNDLEHAVYEKFPLMQILKKTLEPSGALNSMISGSGPSIFALFNSMEKRDAAYEPLAKKLDASVRIICP